MYLGIDLGTSSVKILLLSEEGKIIITDTEEYPIMYPQIGWAEQNPEDWWNATVKVIKRIEEKYGLFQLKGISFSGQMHGLVLLDKNDKVIRPAILWNDQRTEKECEFLNKNEIFKFAGNNALTGFTAPKIIWVKNNEPENFKKIEKIMLPKDYLIYKLSNIHATDTSDASGMLLLDVEKRCWSDDVLKMCDITKKQLPKILESYEVVGEIDKKIAVELNLPEKVKIITGGGDQAVGAIGVGAVEEGILSVALGTSGVVFSSTNSYRVDKKYRLHSFAHANGKYHQMGVMLSATASYKWWVEQINDSKDYEEYNELAKISEVTMENLFFLPYLMGERTPHNNPRARGAFIGLNIEHTKGNMNRAVLEGVGFALNDSLELIKSMGIKPVEARISGGGAKSILWKEILANIFNINIVTVNSTEGPAYGAAILATVGCGKYATVEEACSSLIEKIEIVKPNQEKVKIMNEKYFIFKKLYLGLEEVCF